MSNEMKSCVIKKLSWASGMDSFKPGDLAVMTMNYTTEGTDPVFVPKGAIVQILDTAEGRTAWAYQGTDYATVRYTPEIASRDAYHFYGLLIPVSCLAPAKEEDFYRNGVRFPQTGEKVRFVHEMPNVEVDVITANGTLVNPEGDDVPPGVYTIPEGTIGKIYDPPDADNKLYIEFDSADGTFGFGIYCDLSDVELLSKSTASIILSWLEEPAESENLEEGDLVTFIISVPHVDIPVILFEGMNPPPQYETVLGDIPAGTTGMISEIEETPEGKKEALVAFDFTFQKHGETFDLHCAYLVPLSYLRKL